MNLTIVVPDRLARTPDGATWVNGSCTYEIYARHLAVFDSVRVVARLREVDAVSDEWRRVDGPQITVGAFPYFLGPAQYLRRYSEVVHASKDAVPAGDLPVLRLPAWHLTGHIAENLERRGYPFAVEVMGDAVQTLSNAEGPLLFRVPARWWIGRRTRRACRAAFAALYVTQRSLQQAYPAAPGALSVGCSDVSLADEAFIEKARSFPHDRGARRIVFVGGLETLRKAPEILIEAVAHCAEKLPAIELAVIGGGQRLAELRMLAEKLGLGGRIRFEGHLPAGDLVRDQLDRADLFVLASRSEGLPRSMVEAMARALPCIGSPVGGIPELLAKEFIVEPGDARVLAKKIGELLGDREKLEESSRNNLLTARTFADAVLDARRNDYYRAVREDFAARLATRSGVAGDVLS